MWVPPGLKDHFWNVDHNPPLSRSERFGTILSCWHKKKMCLQMHTSSHSLTALLLFDTNYSVCFVLRPTRKTHVSAQMHTLGNCLLTQMHVAARTHALAYETFQTTIQGKHSFSPKCLPNPEWFNLPFWTTAHTTLSHFILSKRLIQLYIPPQTTHIASLLRHNPSRITHQLRTT